jgi:hypothetical protein
MNGNVKFRTKAQGYHVSRFAGQLIRLMVPLHTFMVPLQPGLDLPSARIVLQHGHAHANAHSVRFEIHAEAYLSSSVR